MPSLNALAVNTQSPPAAAVSETKSPSASVFKVTFALPSVDPIKVGVVSAVKSSLSDAPESLAASKSGAFGVDGAVMSYVALSELELTPWLPAMSVLIAVIVCVPSLKLAIASDHAPPALAVVVPRTPSTELSTERSLDASAVPSTVNN